MYSKRSPPTVPAGIEFPNISMPGMCGIAPSTGINRSRKYSSILETVYAFVIVEEHLPSRDTYNWSRGRLDELQGQHFVRYIPRGTFDTTRIDEWEAITGLVVTASAS